MFRKAPPRSTSQHSGWCWSTHLRGINPRRHDARYPESMERSSNMLSWIVPLFLACAGIAAAVFGLLVWLLKHPADDDVPDDR